ncbi:hypothetical protein VB715_12900 [Crocosphaera sp. UHCC 0190]|uniref:hypothetical protein n=1 Tax=Crocosphaera sp. UHCC 0190 TaxID=3110246 RepID=UPI002B1F112F|nr:hypothetical protein [Crocosphaera sp. UHCC 0190]MEA5510664.1 hypothetical protein [Crocosphaera sp. UHCC 0190]
MNGSQALSWELGRVNITTIQKYYPAKAQFWGRIANGVNQPSTVTLYPKKNQLLVIIILPQNCGRIFQITQNKITKVTHTCPHQDSDESLDYVNWTVVHNPLDKQIKMIAPATSIDNPLYIRKQAFWLITY